MVVLGIEDPWIWGAYVLIILIIEILNSFVFYSTVF